MSQDPADILKRLGIEDTPQDHADPESILVRLGVSKPQKPAPQHQFEWGTVGQVADLTRPPEPEPQPQDFGQAGDVGSFEQITPPQPEPPVEPEPEPGAFERTVKAIPEVGVALPMKAFDQFLSTAIVDPVNAIANWFRSENQEAPSAFEFLSGGEVTPETMSEMVAKGGAGMETASDIADAAAAAMGFFWGAPGKIVQGAGAVAGKGLGALPKVPEWAAKLGATSIGFAAERAVMTEGDPNEIAFGAVAGPIYAGLAKLGPWTTAKLDKFGWNRRLAGFVGGATEGAGFGVAHEAAGGLGWLVGMDDATWGKVAPMLQAAYHMNLLIPAQREEIEQNERLTPWMKEQALAGLDQQEKHWAQQFVQGATQHAGESIGFGVAHAARPGQSPLLPKDEKSEGISLDADIPPRPPGENRVWTPPGKAKEPPKPAGKAAEAEAQPIRNVAFEALHRTATEDFPHRELTPIHAMRERVRKAHGEEAASHENLDPALMELHREGYIQLTPIDSPGMASKAELAASIESVGQHLFYYRRLKPFPEGSVVAPKASGVARQLKDRVGDIHDAVKREAFADQDLTPVHAVRERVRRELGEEAASHAVFDKVLLDLHQAGEIRLTPISTPGGVPEKELAGAIRSVGQHMFYMRRMKAKPADLGSPAGDAETPSNVKRALSPDRATDAKTSVQEIIKHLETVTGAPQRVGKFNAKRRKALGIYKVHEHVARREGWGDLEVAYHEFGHSLQGKLLGFPAKWPNAAVRKELMARGEELYGKRKPKGGYKAEGFAEVIAREILGEDPATFAPETAKWLADVRKKNPDIDAGLTKAREQFETWNRMGDVERWKSHVVKSTKEKPKLGELWQRFRKAMTNDAAPLEDAEARLLQSAGIDPKTFPANHSPSKTRAALKMNAMGTSRHVIEVGMVDTKGNVVGPSLREVLEPVWPKADDFAAYAVAKRAVSLIERNAATGKGKQGEEIVGYSREALDRVIKELETPEFREAVDGVTRWHNQLLDYVVESGGLGADAAEIIRDANPFYVPFFRALEGARSTGMGAKGEVDQPSPVKTLRGSKRAIRDPFETMVESAQRMILAGNKAQVARAIVELGEAVPKSGWFVEKVQLPNAARQIKLKDVKKQLEEQGVDMDGADLDALLTVFEAPQSYKGRENIVAVWRDGKREFYQLDPDVFEVVKGMDKDVMPAFLKATMGKAAKIKRAATTGLNPAFATKNVIRDAWAASLHTKSNKLVDRIPGVLTLRGAGMKLFGDPVVKQFQALGGELGSMMGRDRFESRKQLDNVMADAKRMKAMNVFRNPLEFLQAWNGWFENAPRVAEFKQVLKQAEKIHGKNSRAAVLEALLAGKEVTLNFTRQGTVGGLMNQGIPFWNARMQGPSKFYRTFKERPVQFAAQSFAAVTIPAMVLWWINKDKEWYKARPAWERNRFLLASPDGEGETIFRLALPQDHDYVAAALPVAALQAMYDKDPDLVTAQMWDTFKNLLPAQNLLDIAPALVKPGIEASTNTDTFRGRQIVPQWMEDTKLPQDRYNDWTTETSKQIGKWLGVAPLKVDHMIKEHTGGLVLNTIRHLENMAGWRTDERVEGPWDTPVVGTLFARPGMNDQFVSDFYDRQKLLRQRKSGEQASQGELDELKLLDDMARTMKEIRDSKLPPKVKIKRLRSLAKRGLQIEKRQK